MTGMTIDTSAVIARLENPPPRRARSLAAFAIAAAIFSLPLLRPLGPSNTGIPDAGLVLLVIITVQWASGRAYSLRTPYIVAMGLIVLGGAIPATITGEGGLTLAQDVFVFFWAIALASLGRDPQLFAIAVRTWVVTAVLGAVLMLVGIFAGIPYLSGQNIAEGVRAGYTFGEPNYASNFFLTGLFLLRAARYPRHKVWRWLCVGVLLVALAYNGSNGAFLGLTIGTIAGAFFTRVKRRQITAAILLAGSCLLVAGAGKLLINTDAVLDQVSRISPVAKDSIGRLTSSEGSRGEVTEQTTGMWFNDAPWYGLGPARTLGEMRRLLEPYPKEAHNDYIAALLERGPIGALGILTLMGSLAVRARRVSARDALKPEYERIIPRPELLAAMTGVMAFSGLFYEVLHYRHAWALFGVLAALEIWGRKPQQPGVLP